MEPAIIVHGGLLQHALNFGRGESDYLEPLISAAEGGYKILLDPSKTVLDAVEEAVVIMEDNPMFNAGTGSKLRNDGSIQMDACIMDGKTLEGGAVGVIENVKNPIKVARAVMEKSNHVMLAGSGASEFAQAQGFPFYSNELLKTEFSEKLSKLLAQPDEPSSKKKRLDCDTVGAIAIDSTGNLACAVSTGGLTGCPRGRVGDSCQIGQGLYCDNNLGGVVTTGKGEILTRLAFSKSVLSYMEQGLTVHEALEKVHVNAWERLQCDLLGAIAISRQGDIGWYTLRGMMYAYIKGDKVGYGIRKGEEHTKNRSELKVN